MENSPKKEDRVGGLGRAYAGSQLQIQIYANRRSEELSEKIIEGVSSLSLLNPGLTWVSPIEKDKFIEYRDRDFLKMCDLEDISSELSSFWQNRGPVWDALAIVKFKDKYKNKGILLVEAKSYPGEIYGSGCRASAKSKKKIEDALDKTKKWLGVSMDVDWTSPLYQSANRMAHLYFFREIVEIPAWFVKIYFLND
jgi:hypothetical protein